MNFEIKPLGLVGVGSEKCDALIVLVSQDFKPAKDDLSQLVAQALKSGDLEAKPGKPLSLYRPVQANAVRVVLAGVGEGSARQVRSAVGAALALVKSAALKKLVISFAAPARDEAVRAAVLAAADASYVYTATKSKAEGRTLQKVVLAATNASEVKLSFNRAVATVAGVEVAKEWANRPANHATPTLLGQAAQELAKIAKISCEVLGPKEVAKLGMGSFMAVAQGSEQPLRFIVLRYDGAAKTKAPVVLVGKGITFDSGGISIKPAAEMDEMKFDMSGAASVLGVFRTLGQLKPAINVVGLIPACENLINGRAVKPGDVVTSMSGQTIEILNTDAEGRLVLCDALTYAERFKPAAVVDIATLTGACVVALGSVRSGLFSSNEALGDALMAAGNVAQDLSWRLPLDDEYSEGLKTNFADVANVAGRAGGAITAAKFLQRFTEKFPWAHLDIAGTAWKSGAAKGATGRPVGLLVEYLLAEADRK
ncbi:leucyl aminopeptidase [Rhodoferax saidenbachensis]|uniref:Probable cytosol aminopeptidase n=1 Tax=Rhodoferax saidenbachensis TaxID=1484693 RepID=A0A1P8KA28_9BURK|nr:leucyl aminopeptidase [Rhodoferax saidenbachensis]APW42844.1 leucyl aminopeptidase [Rhodoferax saidenbachensis]